MEFDRTKHQLYTPAIKPVIQQESYYEYRKPSIAIHPKLDEKGEKQTKGGGGLN